MRQPSRRRLLRTAQQTTTGHNGGEQFLSCIRTKWILAAPTCSSAPLPHAATRAGCIPTGGGFSLLSCTLLLPLEASSRGRLCQRSLPPYCPRCADRHGA
jgi:hypothetical protein